MITTKIINAAHQQDINIPNQPFSIYGRMIPSYSDGIWSYTTELFETKSEMCFPDENYNFDSMSAGYKFIGAYDQDNCIGLAILKEDPFRYMYLYDLKVNQAYQRTGVAKLLIANAKAVAKVSGYIGIYTQAQDNNLGACLFYLNCGFRIGGLNTEIYKGTSQEGKSDIIFYLDC